MVLHDRPVKNCTLNVQNWERFRASVHPLWNSSSSAGYVIFLINQDTSFCSKILSTWHAQECSQFRTQHLWKKYSTLRYSSNNIISMRSTRRPHLLPVSPRRYCVYRSSTVACPWIFPRHVRLIGFLMGFLPCNTLSVLLPSESSLYMLTVQPLT